MNTLYPIFLKLNKLHILIIGAGNVGYEKLHFILKNSPDAHITVVAPQIAQPVWDLVDNDNYRISVIQRHFLPSDVTSHQLIIAATNNQSTNEQIWKIAKRHNILINVADTPALCDFYLSSIVTKGDLKIAISTNGKSPTLAKRFRQLLEKALPNETTDLLNQLYQLRSMLGDDFQHKLRVLNQLTNSLLETESGK